jgi:hypothetical protein
VSSEKTKQTVRERIGQLRRSAASEPNAWTRALLMDAATDFERMLAANDPILFSLPIALEQTAHQQAPLWRGCDRQTKTRAVRLHLDLASLQARVTELNG